MSRPFPAGGSIVLRGRLGARVDDLAAHLRVPMYRNAYALMLSNVLTSGLGIVYWALAARIYTADAVGRNSALVSSMTLLAGISQLNLRSALNRFIPEAGTKTSRLIGYAYLVTLPVTVVAGIIFFAIMSVTSPDSAQAAIAAVPLAAAGFIVVTAAWSIFNMQDGVLTGLRQALIVPVENSTFSVAKIVLLIGLSGFAAYGIFLSWAIPTVIGVFLISLIVFRWLIPIHVRNSREVARPLELNRIVRFVTGDYLGALCVLAYVSLLPVIVIDRAGPEAGAYFYIVWIIYTSLNLLPLSITISHTVETVSTKGDPIARTRGALVHAMRLMIPIVAVVIIGAPWILAIFGPGYAANGTDLLRLLALSVIPYSINLIYFSLARIRAKVTGIFVVQAILAVMTLALSFPLLDAMGVTGIGVATLISQGSVALVLLATELRPVLLSRGKGY
jgi:O-antigen/teichoic acid export membrane protein